MAWDHVHQDGPESRSKPLLGYRVLSSDRAVSKDNLIGFMAGDALKAQIKRAGKKNRRNMSEEIISILTWYYAEFGEGVVYDRHARYSPPHG